MYIYAVENWDTGKHFGEYALATDDFTSVLMHLAKKLHMTTDSALYDDGMISQVNHFLRDADGAKYRVFYLRKA
jgi:1-aminocyclopropane-1-carboxylate deaminase/D-cysteine desulfhydrase-like pyridoxal-dependent ACC family enzyme